MKKIMFKDNYGLTKSVLEGRKTMTSRFFDYEKYRKLWEDMCRLGMPCFKTFNEFLLKRVSRYKMNEVVAVAQAYTNAFHPLDRVNRELYEKDKGWNNKMFVKANLMPHKIRITDIKVEQLQDISDEDCLKEGVVRREIRPFREIEIKYQVPRTVIYKDNPKDAFAALIDKVGGKGTWERNSYVFAYEFEIYKEGCEE